jgi:hypothetical protein
MKLFGGDVNFMSLWDIVQMLAGRGGHASPISSEGGKQDTHLKANIFGIGTNDETLFWEAVAIAEAKKWIKSPTGRQNLAVILDGLNHWEKGRFCEIIGKDSQNVVIETHAESVAAASAGRRRSKAAPDQADHDDAAKIEKTSLHGNIRGAMIVALFANMPPAEALKLLHSSGTLSDVTDDLKHLYEKISGFFGKTEAGRKVLAYLKEAALQYLESATPEEAEKKVAEKKLELERRQKQSWYERDLKNRRTLLGVWLILVTIIIVGGAYVFSH